VRRARSAAKTFSWSGDPRLIMGLTTTWSVGVVLLLRPGPAQSMSMDGVVLAAAAGVPDRNDGAPAAMAAKPAAFSAERRSSVVGLAA
jgi:hypothetical protein